MAANRRTAVSRPARWSPARLFARSTLLVLPLCVTAQGALQVSPASGLSATGLVGGPFTPDRQTYTLTNTAMTGLAWTVEKTQSWVSLSSSSGTLPPYGYTTVTVLINSNADSLAAGTYGDTVAFTNHSVGGGSTTRNVTLTIDPRPGNLQLTPMGDLVSSGPVGGPFSPSGKDYTLTNTGDLSLSWAAGKTQPWVSLSQTGGTLGAGASTTVTVNVNASAAGLAVGGYSDTVNFTNTTNGSGNTIRSVELTVQQPGILELMPADGLESRGLAGGPFSPSGMDYTLTNTGGLSLSWAAGKTQPWVSLSQTGGTLSAGTSITVTISINTNAASMPIGGYNDTVTFTNTTNHVGDSKRAVSLTVEPPWDCHVDPTIGSDAWDGRTPAWDGTHGPKRTIQAGVDSIGADCRVILAPGTYSGPGNRDVWLLYPRMTVQSIDPQDPAVVAATILECEGQDTPDYHRAFHIPGSSAMPEPTVLSGLTIQHGWSDYGGAIYIDNAAVRVSHCIFGQNKAVEGGAVYALNADVEMLSCRLMDSQAEMGSAIRHEGYGSCIVYGCVLEGNASSTAHGGTIGCTWSPVVTIANCTIRGSYDPAVNLDQVSLATIRNCLLCCNYTDTAAVWLDTSQAAISHCTFIFNAPEICMGSVYATSSACLITDSIVWDSGLDGTLVGDFFLVRYSNIRRGWGGTGNIRTDPAFVNPDGPDGNASAWQDNDYHLRPDSPCRNTGDPTYSPAPDETDIDGQPRVMAERTDMGCDEFTWVGDVNLDGYVDVVDLLWLVDAFGSVTGDANFDPRCDFNNDGSVDVVDLLDLVFNFGT
jgi:hypothetical protein